MDALEVDSTPSGAHVEVTRNDTELSKKEIKENTLSTDGYSTFGPLVGQTPTAFRLKRKGDYKVVISKEGYETITVEVTHKTAGAGAAGMAGNVLVGGVIGVVVDAGTGATQSLVPNPIKVILTKEKDTENAESF